MMVVINVWRKHQHGKVNFDLKNKPRILFITFFYVFAEPATNEFLREVKISVKVGKLNVIKFVIKVIRINKKKLLPQPM